MIAIDAPLPLDSEPPRGEAAPPPDAGSPLAAALAAALERIGVAAGHPDPAKMVHQARKAMKEYRALLRLVPGPAARTARREMAATARTLASARDHAAAQEALERLRDRSEISAGDFKAARALIGADAPADGHLAVCRDTLSRFRDAPRLAEDLAAAAAAADLPAGLARTYRRARAGRFRSAETMHALRKDVVVHRYQMSFIAAWFGGRGHRRAERAQALRDLLGLHHDMEVLDPMLAEVADSLGPPATRRVRKAAHRQQKDLRRQARRLHGKLFRRRPKAFARLWRDLTVATPETPPPPATAPSAPSGTAGGQTARPDDWVSAGSEAAASAPQGTREREGTQEAGPISAPPASSETADRRTARPDDWISAGPETAAFAPQGTREREGAQAAAPTSAPPAPSGTADRQTTRLDDWTSTGSEIAASAPQGTRGREGAQAAAPTSAPPAPSGTADRQTTQPDDRTVAESETESSAPEGARGQEGAQTAGPASAPPASSEAADRPAARLVDSASTSSAPLAQTTEIESRGPTDPAAPMSSTGADAQASASTARLTGGSAGRNRAVPSRAWLSATGAVAQPVPLDFLRAPLAASLRTATAADLGSPWARSPEPADAPSRPIASTQADAATSPRHSPAGASSRDAGPTLRKKDAAVQEVSAPSRFIESPRCSMKLGAAANTGPAETDPAELHPMSESQPGLPAVTIPRATVPVRPAALPAASPAGGTVPNRLFARFIAGISALHDADFEAGDGPEAFRAVDRAASALTARLTGGLSPIAMTLATMDWAMHLAGSPGKQAELWLKATRKISRFTSYMLASTLDPSLPPCIAPLKDDDRFRAPQWQQLPYRFWYQGFLLTQQFWHNATTGVPGVSSTNARRVAFGARQALDVLSPANFPFTNPEVVERTRKTGGLNFIQGARNAAENLARKAMHQPPAGAEAFVPGETVAVTPGEVIYRNHLIELIQYRATTPDVAAEPILIVPAWIMKYYILDLSPQNSLIRYLVDKGHTVFCISWRNVSAADRDIGLNDYLRLGLMAALDVVGRVCPGHKVHAAGYCLGGTLLAIGAAAMAKASDQRLASMTLFAAQTDFSEPGELELFVDESELYFLESMMWDKGFLTAGQMAGAFQMLRSNDLVWSRMVREYMMGERTPLNDLMAWNADATRMPFRMHSEYLRRLFLKNDLAAGRYEVNGRPVSLLNLRLPLFVVGTERDHVAPWRSVYKIHQLTDTDVTFVLASGGHNAGIVSEPGHRNRSYRLHETRLGELHLGPEEWMETNPRQDGSWWPAWEAWLTEHSSAGRYSLPSLGIPGQPVLGPAPGTYVMQR